MQWPEAWSSEAKHIREVVTKWLISKGAAGGGSHGSYQPEDGSIGTFTTEEAVDGLRSWWMVRLDEQTPEGRCFSVAVSITTRKSLQAMHGRLSDPDSYQSLQHFITDSPAA